MRKIPKLIYNDDSCSLREVEPPHDLARIAAALDIPARAGVERFNWCLYSGIALSYHSERFENYVDMAASDPGVHGRATRRNLIASLEKQGIDYLPILIQECRKRGMEFFASFRVNDCHSKGYPQSAVTSSFWRNHPQYRLWSEDDILSYYNGCFDFTFPEIRNRFCSAIEEVTERYDVDGIELDFLREPYLFPSGKTFEDKARIIAEMLGKIRGILKKAAIKHGREPELSARIPLSASSRKSCGIDLESLLDSHLLDSVIAGVKSSNANESLETFSSICRKRQIPCFGDIETAPISRFAPGTLLAGKQIPPPHSYQYSMSAAEFKAYAAGMSANLWGQQLDGIYLFNFACRIFEPGGRYGVANTDADNQLLAEAIACCANLEQAIDVDRCYYFWDSLPIYAEALRPEECHQQIAFHFFDHILPKEKITLHFRVLPELNPHCGEPPFALPEVPAKELLQVRLNGQNIDLDRIKITPQHAGRIPSGFTIDAHELWELELTGSEFQQGKNLLGFFMPHAPAANSPYIYIHDLTIRRISHN